MFKYLIFFLLMGVIPLQWARADQLTDLIDLAMQANPEISSANFAYQSQKESVPAMSTLPDPLFSVEFRGAPLNPADAGDTREVMFMAQQMFPYPGKLRQAGTQTELMAESKQSMADAARINIRSRIQVLYYQLVQVDQALAINAENQQLVDQFIEIATAKYTVGNASQAEVLQAQMERSQLNVTRLDLAQKRQTLAADLNRILRRSSETIIETDSLPEQLPVVPVLTDILPLIEQDQPLLVTANQQIQASEVGIDLAKLQTKPDLTVMAGYVVMNDMPDAWTGRVSINVPFAPWSDADNRAKIQSMIAQKRQREADYQMVQDRLEFELTETHSRLSTLNGQIDIYRAELIPQAQQIIDASIAGYQTDLVDFLTLISVQRKLQDIRLQYVTLVSQYYQSWAQLEKTAGRPISQSFN